MKMGERFSSQENHIQGSNAFDLHVGATYDFSAFNAGAPNRGVPQNTCSAGGVQYMCWLFLFGYF